MRAKPTADDTIDSALRALTPARADALRDAAAREDGMAYPNPRVARALRNLGLADGVTSQGYGMHITEEGRAVLRALDGGS